MTFLKTVLSYVSLATRGQKLRRRFPGISSFPTRGHSLKSDKRRRSWVEAFGRKALSPCGRTVSLCWRSQLQFVCSDGVFVVVLCLRKPPSTGPKGRVVLSLEFLRTQQWGLDLDFKSSGPNPVFHDTFSMARNLRQVHDLTLTRLRESTVVADFADFDMHAAPVFIIMFMGSQEK